jgi:hypothetical protein
VDDRSIFGPWRIGVSVAVGCLKDKAEAKPLRTQMLAYDELRGSTGREIWYRPPRYEAQKLFPGTPPRLRAGSDLYQIHNICLGGVGKKS